jgi:hypothetical protein
MQSLRKISSSILCDLIMTSISGRLSRLEGAIPSPLSLFPRNIETFWNTANSSLPYRLDQSLKWLKIKRLSKRHTGVHAHLRMNPDEPGFDHDLQGLSSLDATVTGHCVCCVG